MTIKVKLRKSKTGYTALMLIKHAMETGNRKDKKTGKVIPAHYVSNMVVSVNGTEVATAHLSQAVSKNPLIGVSIDAKSGDVVSVASVDNLGNADTGESTVK